MVIAVTGGTGMAGREVVRELRRRGHEVRSLSRRTGVDLLTGAGLAAALEGADAVIEASNAGPGRRKAEPLLVGGTRRLLDAERAAGVAHHVAVSIVGIDRVPAGYYGVKVAQEAVVREGEVPWTIVRATQFHGLVASYLSRAARFGVLPGPAFPLQPVDPREVAVVLADTVEDEPSGAITQFAGPECRTVRELAQTWRLETGSRARVIPLPVPGATGRALHAGGLTNPGAWRGRIPFGAWLRGAAPVARERERVA
jgi:uncharacterized protein YbjT (DUF2867 family)